MLLINAGTPNAFIRRPVATKEMWMGVQEFHRMTLSGCFVIDGTRNAEQRFRDVTIEMEECGDNDTPLHLKLVIYHENRLREGDDMPLDWSDCKTVLMPRQHLLKKLDPSGLLNVPQLRSRLKPLVEDFERLVLKDVAPPGLTIKKALEIYGHFNLIRFMPDWTENEIPVSCSCKTCLNNCVCRCTLLFGALFRPEIRVPDDYVAATVPQRKACRSIRGLAGKKRQRIIEDLKSNEKIVDSKIKYMKSTIEPPHLPSPVLPSDSDDEIEVAST